MTHDEAIDWLYGTQLFGIKLGLDPVRRLLDELGVPTGRVDGRTIVHVAGTNGKGSVCAMIERLARYMGRRTALFTSPHLVEFRERARVLDRKIPEKQVARLLTEIRNLVADWEPHPTFFEITLAMSARYFTEWDTNLWVLETGMGGRLDATNVFESDFAVLTPIALDHQQWLGSTLGEIAAEKAGIIKEGSRVFSAPQADEALEAILDVCADVEIVEGEVPGSWEVGLAGAHQRRNAALAVAVARGLDGSLELEWIRSAIAEVSWPGRFQRFDRGQLILDGAHNPSAAAVLVETWRETFGSERATVILGAAGNKDIDSVLDELCKIAAVFIFVPIKSQRSLSPVELADALGDRCPSAQTTSLQAALNHATYTAPTGLRILVTGSLFLVGEALALRKGKSEIRETEQ